MNSNGALYTLSQQQVIITPGTVYGIKYIIIVFCSLDILNNIHLIHVPKEAFLTKSQLPCFRIVKSALDYSQLSSVFYAYMLKNDQLSLNN